MMEIQFNVFDLIAFAVYIISLIMMLAINLKQRKKNTKLVSDNVQLILDKGALIQKIESMNIESSKEANDGFVRFLSESRDWAFSYIEDVQESMRIYQSSLSGTDPVEAMKARERLFSLLPDTKNN